MKALNPLKSIRKYCLCCGGQAKEVRRCMATTCPLYPFRFGRGQGQKLKAIRERCLDCTDGPSAVKSCKIADCHLYPYRMGKNPNRKGIGKIKNIPLTNNFRDRRPSTNSLPLV